MSSSMNNAVMCALDLGPTIRGVFPRRYFLRVILAAVLCRSLEPAASRAPVRERLRVFWWSGS